MRIVIADDSALLREGVAGLLTRRGHEVVGQVSDAPSLAGVVDEQRPDLVITDVRMPPDMRDDGLRAALPPGYGAGEPVAGRYVVQGRIDPGVLSTITTWCAQQGALADDVQVARRSLEDVFLQVTGRTFR